VSRYSRTRIKAERVARINRLYNKYCCGRQINVIDISKVFKEGYSCMDANPNITDDALGTALLDFAKSIEHRA